MFVLVILESESIHPGCLVVIIIEKLGFKWLRKLLIFGRMDTPFLPRNNFIYPYGGMGNI